MTKIFNSVRAQRFLIPDIYDVLIEFEPRGNDPGLTADEQSALKKGIMKTWAYHVTKEEALALSTSTDKPFATTGKTQAEKDIELKDIIKYVELLATSADGEYTERITKEGNSEYDFEVIENQDTLPVSIEAVEEGDKKILDELLSDEVLVTVGGVEITQKQAVIGGTALIVIIVVATSICCAISYWKRKRIAAEARRASNYIRRSTATLRASIRKARGKPTPEDEAKPMTD